MVKLERDTLLRRAAVALLTWYFMLVCHESGHVLHALASGGTVQSVDIPLVGFSYTRLGSNPAPIFVAWGGAVWGAILPALPLAVAAALRSRLIGVAQFAWGFCCIANGAYLAVGGLTRAGDADDLLRGGVPLGALVAIGVPMIAAGLFVWHIAGRSRSAGSDTTSAA